MLVKTVQYHAFSYAGGRNLYKLYCLPGTTKTANLYRILYSGVYNVTFNVVITVRYVHQRSLNDQH